MSTLRSTLFAILSVAALGAAATHPLVQGGVGPIKVAGPSSISPSLLTVYKEVVAGRTIFYYTVTLNQVSAFDTTVYITDDNHIIQHPSSIVVPAGSLTKTFAVTPFNYGTVRLTASNSISYAYEDIEVVS